jgi:hypothetical protein
VVERIGHPAQIVVAEEGHGPLGERDQVAVQAERQVALGARELIAAEVLGVRGLEGGAVLEGRRRRLGGGFLVGDRVFGLLIALPRADRGLAEDAEDAGGDGVGVLVEQVADDAGLGTDGRMHDRAFAEGHTGAFDDLGVLGERGPAGRHHQPAGRRQRKELESH